MTARRLWVLTSCLWLASCGSGTAASQAAAGTVAVELGPLPTRVTVAPVAASTLPAPTTSVAPAAMTTSTTSTSAVATSSTSLPLATADPTKTSCRSVAYIGDSVSLGMVSAAALADPSARLDARLAAVGVTDLRVEVSGGRSIVETLPGQENARDVAARLRASGFVGCWILAVGTNDAANIAAGGRRQAAERVASMMSVIGSDPVVWLDAATVATDGFWASANMQSWDAALASLVAAYPNVSIAPWSGFVRPEWYQPDGVHLVDAGSAARVSFVATVLVADLPRLD